MSTPIETNTEELRGILEDVYNLPARNSESQPDLVIGLQIPYGGALTEDYLDDMTFSVKRGSAANTFNKLKNQEEVKVFMEHEYWYSDFKFTGVFHPTVVSACDFQDGKQGVSLEFLSAVCPGGGYPISQVSVYVLTDGSIGPGTVRVLM